MSTIFSNDKDTNGVGFFPSDIHTVEIQDQVENADYHAINKMGTSIPTPLARIFLFSSAYKDVTSQVADTNKLLALETLVTTAALSSEDEEETRGPGIYHNVISNHLDLLEYIFLKGANSLRFLTWDKANRLAELREGPNPFTPADKDLKNLGDALKEALDFDLDIVDKLTIIYDKNHNTALGATSPLTIVYSNPNWARYVKDNPSQFSNSIFAQTEPKPLFKRNENFRRLLYLLYKAGAFDVNITPPENVTAAMHQNWSQPMKEFGDYLKHCLEVDVKLKNEIETLYHENMAKGIPSHEWVKDEIEKFATTVKDDQNDELIIEGTTWPLYVQNTDAQSTGLKSQYEIKMSPAKLAALHDEIDGAKVDIKNPPLFLPERGISGAIYYNGERWNPARNVVPKWDLIKDTPISQRSLPGPEVKYPYITEDDLLEPTLFEAPFNINKDNFYTASAGNVNFLLPIKKEIFRFFTFDEVKEMLKITYNSASETATVTLAIPMAHLNRPITITREYTGDKIVSGTKLNLGIFPFFRLKAADGVTDATFTQGGIEKQKNIYEVFLAHGLTSVDVAFYPFDNVMGKQIAIERVPRTKNGQTQTEHIQIHHPFDLIEVNSSPAKGAPIRGLVIPEMAIKQIGNHEYAFAIDFGTSNTHIAWADLTKISSSLSALQIKPEDVQMVYLDTKGTKTSFQSSNIEAMRECVPQEIGPHHARGLKFPIRTAVYETMGLKESDRKLFSAISIGFNFAQELNDAQAGNRYETDIKWDIQSDGLSNDRIKAFCKELFWILRNKSIMHDGSDAFILRVTYPQSMAISTLNNYKSAWKAAAAEFGVQFDPVDTFQVESVAPYYSLTHNPKSGVGSTDVYVNIDIGGGSSDILYVDPKHNSFRSYSAVFAANVLWGNGADPALRDSKDNGFTLNYETKCTQKHPNYDTFKNNWARNSSDVVSWLFSNHPEEFRTTIMGSPLKSLLVVHLSAIIYYVARIIKAQDLAAPKVISFTGMGSKYISMMSCDDNTVVERLINAIFTYVGVDNNGKDINIKVVIQNNPKEITAEGAVYVADPNQKKITPTQSTFFGVDKEGERREKAFTGNDVVLTEGTLEGGRALPKTRAIDEVKTFWGMLANPDYRAAANDLGFNLEAVRNAGLMDEDEAATSYDLVASAVSRDNRDMPFKEPIFFWPIKNMIYKTAMAMANK